MTNKILIFVLCIFLGCASDKKESTASDSTNVVTDTTLVTQESDVYTETSSESSEPEAEEPPPPKNFPAFSAALEGDKLEQSLIDLLKEYDAKDYYSIRNEYSVSYRAEVGPDEEADITVNENKVWLYDSAFRLRAFIRRYFYDNGYGIDKKEISRTCLFDGDSIIAIYEDDGPYKHTRILRSSCPTCGVSFDSPVRYDTEYFYLREGGFFTISREFYTDYNNVINFLKKAKIKKVRTPDDEGEEYTLTQDLEIVNVPYTVEYFMDITLYEKLKQL